MRRVEAAWVRRISRQAGLYAPGWMTVEWINEAIPSVPGDSERTRLRICLLVAVARRELQGLRNV